jgi:hypothetical protein
MGCRVAAFLQKLLCRFQAALVRVSSGDMAATCTLLRCHEIARARLKAVALNVRAGASPAPLAHN